MKLEAFIFDTFPMSRSMDGLPGQKLSPWCPKAILETFRDEEFAPVKNAPGAISDSLESQRIPKA